jgi:hypothetical protein
MANWVWLVQDVLNEFELNCFRSECDHNSRRYSLEDYAESSCAIDLFENISLQDDDPARSDETSYFNKRWNESIDEISKIQIPKILLQKLPQLLQALIGPKQLFLFNEHYVVKPPMSNIIFRWHRDIEEQLQCFPMMASHTQYYSLWCPLDATTSENGSLIIPLGSEIRTVSYQELISGNIDFTGLCRSEITNVLSTEGEGTESLEGKTIIASPGSVIVFSSHLLHCSGPNSTSHARRVFYSQYSETVISTASTSQSPPPLCFAIPCHLNPHPPSPSTPELKRRRVVDDDDQLDSLLSPAPPSQTIEQISSTVSSNILVNKTKF